MDLEARVVELERRLAALEAREAQQAQDVGRREPAHHAGDFWALEGLKARLAEHSADDDGGVLFTGAVGLPTGERYEWQQDFPTGELLGDPAEDRQRTADALAALGSPVRIRLLREILAGRRTAAELTALDGVGTSGQVYHHLRQLSAAGWLHTTGRGRYEVPGGRVVPLLVLFAAATA
ncbi:helix-turn-helix transcriptional regulator [Streptomyces sp. BR123]|uniref:ArsR/SmtB family transcription factor n=1 Tax=Streptomyces sp. BR123 TaxID=2749828 RepID=UPI0015C4A7FD|nr:helix-turn-helix domain-containing protein [Streptomyces sp. BR123]NXY96038.1 helix-turn-helix transcriptional regulator [Streptomyces sp. BR123]